MVVKTKIKIDRRSTIAEVLRDLAALKNRPNVNQYAVDENIAFFEACRSLPSYIWWLIKRAPKIDGEKLLEVNDLLPKWDREMHEKLVALEKKNFPGLLKLFAKKMEDFISSHQKDLLIFANIGCGGMEIERQVIKSLLSHNNKKSIIFIGIDQSLTAHQLARNNLKELNDQISLFDVGELDRKLLKEILSKWEGQFLVILCRNNIFELDKHFLPATFDLIFHSLFKHHLTPYQKVKIDGISHLLALAIMEHDGYLSWFLLVGPHTITAWNNPIFLNATIFSDLRYLTKKELVQNRSDGKFSFSTIGTYLFEKI